MSKQLRDSKEVCWDKENQMLEDDAESISQLKKEIDKEANKDTSVQMGIADKVQDLKSSVAQIVKRLEKEKLKNSELELIIKHIKNKREEEKRVTASSRNASFGGSPDAIQDCDRRIKKDEYDLEQTNAKCNKIREHIKEKKNKIDIFRTERVIDSGIFKNIEKQLNTSENEFKKLMIEKTKHQKVYDIALHDYNSLKEKAKNLPKNTPELQKKKTSEDTFMHGVPEIEHGCKFTQVEPQLKTEKVLQNKTPGKREDTSPDEEQYIIEKLLIETSLENPQDLLYYLEELDRINTESFVKINEYTDRATQIEKYLVSTAEIKQSKKFNFYQVKKVPTKGEKKIKRFSELQQEVNCVNTTIQGEVNQIKQLLKDPNFNHLAEQFSLGVQNQEEGINYDAVETLFMELEESFIHALSELPMPEEERGGTGGTKSNLNDKLDDLFSKVKKVEASDKVMKRSEFREEYQRILKNRSNSVRNLHKKSIVLRRPL